MSGYHEDKNCIDLCLACAAVCNHCASSCTQEPDVAHMARCIQLDMECAAICYATAQLLSLEADMLPVCVSFARMPAMPVRMSAGNMTMSTVRNARGYVRSARRLAGQ